MQPQFEVRSDVLHECPHSAHARGRACADDEGGPGRLLRLQQRAVRAARRQEGHARRQQGQQGQRINKVREGVNPYETSTEFFFGYLGYGTGSFILR